MEVDKEASALSALPGGAAVVASEGAGVPDPKNLPHLHASMPSADRIDCKASDTATPLPHRRPVANARPLVTEEKEMAKAAASDANPAAAAAARNDTPFSVAVACPDGSVVHLSPDSSDDAKTHVVLGRGRLGIPSSVAHVSKRACVLRLVDTSGGASAGAHDGAPTKLGRYSLELVVLGSQPCRVTRSSSEYIFAKSIAQILEDGDDFSPTSIAIRDEDVVEPYERPADWTVEEAEKNGVYYPFKVSITGAAPHESGSKEIDGAAFVEASRKIDAAAQQEVCQPSLVTVGTQTTVEEAGIDSMTVGTQTTCDHVRTNLEDQREEGVECNEKLKESSQMSAETAPTESKGGTSDDSGGNAQLSASQSQLLTDVEMSEPPSLPSKPTSEEPKKAAAQRALEQPFEGRGSPTEKSVQAGVGPSITGGKASAASPAEPHMLDLSSSDESSVDEIAPGEAYYELKDILESVDSPGSFAVGGSCKGKLLMPGLVVDGVGTVGLPLSQNQANELAKRCVQAPFGRGSETVVDKSVRNTFQLEPKHFQITNPSWKAEIEGLTREVCRDLGVQCHLKVEAQLYKLLLYEEGSFFAPHRDSEKVEGMWGTLVIVLPSQFAGGEVVVKHSGDTKTFDQATLSGFGSQYAAFYADCRHEIKEVTSGHRLCLVYNLVKVGRFGALPKAGSKHRLARKLKAAARQWSEEYSDKKLILWATHSYTRAGMKNGIGSAKYKGRDAAVVELLELANEQDAVLDFDYGVASLTEYGTGEGDCWGRGWGDYERDYSWDETQDSNYSLTLSTWGDADLNDDETDILREYYEDSDPIDTTYEPTGNEGINAGRQYADAGAIVIWPRSQRWKIATKNSTVRMCDYLLKACTEGTLDSEPKEDCIKKAEAIIPRVYNEKACAPKLMKGIAKIGDVQLGKKFLTSYITASPKGTPDAIVEQIQSFIDCFGMVAIRPLLVSVITPTRFLADPTATVSFLLKCRTALCKKVSNVGLLQEMTESFVNAMWPQVEKDRCAPTKAFDSFPLDTILDMLVGWKSSLNVISFLAGHTDNPGALAKRILEGYVWMSCQQIKAPVQYSWQARSKEPEGPTRLLSAALSIVSLCEAFGWREYEDVLVDGVQKLCLHGKSETTVALVEKLAPPAPSSGEESVRFRIVARMASVACDNVLAGSTSASLDTHKRLVKIIGTFCPSVAPRYVESAKGFDVDKILFPLVSDQAVRASSGSMNVSLGLLTLHCAQIMETRVSSSTKLGGIMVWSLPHASLSRNTSYASFLQSPCRQVLDWQVRKSDHKGFLNDLKPLIGLGEVKAESHQPRGRGQWHFRITKTKSTMASVSSLAQKKCDCSNGKSSRYSTYQQRQAQATNCRIKRHKADLAKHSEDQKRLLVLKSLLTQDQRRELEGSRGPDSGKRPASITTCAPSASAATPSTPANRMEPEPQRPTKKSKPSSSSEVIDLT